MELPAQNPFLPKETRPASAILCSRMAPVSAGPQNWNTIGKKHGRKD
jgi:hypothetical protein